MVVDAEKFRASVDPLKGKEKVLVEMGEFSLPHIEVNSDSQGFKHEEVDDDEYFHLMCHIDGSLKSKIEKGGFVELDKLLPKKKMCQEDKWLEWVTKDGMTFLSPAQDREQRITNVKKWDQAFRVYAAIYCGANPLRARKVWQYIYVIHSATASYQWDNVAYYDYTFRQMMAERPNRKWGKTYAQLWQLALRDPITKTYNEHGYRNAGANNYSNNAHGNGTSSQPHQTWRDNCCWKFNRTGKCDKPNCQFDNRCSYCGAWRSHGSNTCKKMGAMGENNLVINDSKYIT